MFTASFQTNIQTSSRTSTLFRRTLPFLACKGSNALFKKTPDMAAVAAAAPATSAATCYVAKHPPFLAPAVFAGAASRRYRGAIADGCTKMLRVRKSLPVSHGLICESKFPNLPTLPISSISYGPHRQLHACSSKEKPFSHLSVLPITMFGEQNGPSGGIPWLPRQRKSMSTPKAYKDNFFSFRYPVLDEKPEWWWRTLACVPYLISLKASDIGFYLQPFLDRYEKFGNLIYFVPGGIARLPTWFSILFCYAAYFGFVTKKEWPHFFRFNLMMALLFETAIQLVWVTSNFFPLIHYNGTFGVQYWGFVGFAYIFILLQCIRNALDGGYANIPFISDAAYIHTLFNIGGFQRPF